MKRKIKKIGNVLTAAQQKEIFGGVKSANTEGNARFSRMGVCYIWPEGKLIYVRCGELCPDGKVPFCHAEPLLL